MSIRQMCNETDEGAYADLHWSHDQKRPIYMRETHVGIVLGTGERNGYDDSDFYAIVWDDAKGAPDEITYASTRGWTYPNGANVDATPDIVQKYDNYYRDRAERARRSKKRCDAATPTLNKHVEVVGGRKLPVGTKAVVGWYGKDRFARHYDGPRLSDHGIYDSEGVKDGFRVGLKVGDSTTLVFVSAKHVKVLETAP